MPTPRRNDTTVVMLLPLKQGLKPGGVQKDRGQCCRCYATSIKTRIETFTHQPPLQQATRCYATSIKTRIETVSESRA